MNSSNSNNKDKATGGNEPPKKTIATNNADAPEVDTDITDQEKELLDNAGTEEDSDEVALHDADLDSTDEDGTPLNEKASARDRSGRDLDVPGADNDNAMEDIGEEDEENNSYSLKDGDT